MVVVVSCFFVAQNLSSAWTEVLLLGNIMKALLPFAKLAFTGDTR